MGEQTNIVVSPLVEVMLDKLASSLLRDFGSTWEVEKELGELSYTLQKIHAMLGFVEEMQTKDELVKFFLKDLRGVAFYAEDALDEFIYAARRGIIESIQSRKRKQVPFFLPFSLNANQILRRHEIAPLIIEFTNKLVDIGKKLEPHYLTRSTERRQCETLKKLQIVDTRQMSSSLVDESYVFGRNEDVDKIKSMLLSDHLNGTEVPVVSINGIGGIGKTTLVQLIYNDPDVQNHFDVRAWVCVSHEFNVEKLTRAILNSATRKTSRDLEDLEPLQCQLQDMLRGKRSLLVLDDVWNENRSDWDALRVPLRVAEKSSRIIVTTRSDKVSSIMGATQIHYLQGLSDKDCWSLFMKRAFTDENSGAYPNLKAIGRKIVKRCKGLPLAVNTLGGLVHAKLDEREWKFILESEIWELEENNIFPALGLSYHHLPAHLKRCFTYCSLFPKGYEFEKKTLVLHWMAEGFVPSKQAEMMEDIGGRYFDHLLQSCFFQRSREEGGEAIYVMHDLMHDLAQSVSRELYFRMESDKSGDVPEMARHVSLNADLDLVDKGFYNCRRISTFLSISGHLYGGEQVLHGLFLEWRCLRVLDLSRTHLKSLPDSIGNLKHLGYLNISSTDIIELPNSICNLYNLQTLNLEDCHSLSELPKDTRNLISLQNLMMDREFWKAHRPQGIGRLTHLKTLPYFVVNESDGFKLRELKELQHLQGQLWISKLEKVANAMEAKEANLQNKRKLDELKLKWSKGFGNQQDKGNVEAVLNGLQPHKGLKHLEIKFYNGFRFPGWMMTDLSCYDKLVSLTLSYCKKCKFLPPFWQLPLLESLKIVGMEELTHLNQEFYGDVKNYGGKKGFQSLKSLTLSEMHVLEEWFGADKGEFPRLKELTIFYCPKLKKLPPFLPTIEVLRIESCYVLTSIPKLPSLRDLKLSDCDERILNWMHQCTSLSSLHISLFREAITLPQAMLQPLVALQSCKIFGFHCLMSLLEDVGLHNLAYLQNLEIRDCGSLMLLPYGLHNLNSLEELTIQGCNQLLSLGKLPTMLKQLCISTCKHLNSLPMGLENLTSLQVLRIQDCDKLQTFPEEKEGGLPPMLKHLEISTCKNLMSLPKGLHKLTFLQDFTIDNCDGVELFLEEEEEHLPPMLKRLFISNCDQMMFLPKGLRNLLSLEELFIKNCNNLTSLQEVLPTSLLTLAISGCTAELKSRCQEGGEDWPIVAHIPEVKICLSS